MGYLKLDPSCLAEPARIGRHADRPPGRADITLPPHQFAGPKPRPKDHLSGAEQYALAHLAQRFAPGGQSVLAPEDQRLPIRLPPTRLVRAAPRGLRTLIAVLIVIALLPSATLAAMYWLGAVDLPGSRPLGAEDKEGAGPRFKSAAVMARLDNVASKRTARIRPVILAAPAKLEAHAGGDITLAIKLDRTGALPARSIIAISGLPRGATLSSGRPYGETGWNLRSDEVGGLRLILAEVAPGESTLRIKLVAPDGRIIAGTETILKLTPAEPVPRPQSNERLPETWDPLEVYPLPPGVLYAPNLVSIGAWDAQFRQLVATPSIDAIATNLKTPAAPADPEQPQPASAAETVNDDPHTKWIEPSAFVNLRQGPSSSAAVIGVIAKGTKLSLRARKRGWMQVANPATSEIGWIYAGNVSGEKLRRGSRRPADSGLSSPGSDTLWSGLGQWLTSR